MTSPRQQAGTSAGLLAYFFSSMKKIRLLTSVAGTTYSFGAGAEVDVDDAIAQDLIQAGHAVPLAPADTRENKTSPQAAKAEKRSKQ